MKRYIKRRLTLFLLGSIVAILVTSCQTVGQGCGLERPMLQEGWMSMKDAQAISKGLGLEFQCMTRDDAERVRVFMLMCEE
jgi:hypothetical protein